MEPAWMRACLSLVLIGWLSCLFIALLLLMCVTQERHAAWTEVVKLANKASRGCGFEWPQL